MANRLQSQNPSSRKDHIDAILRSVGGVERLERRFFAKVERRGCAECWPWTAAKTERGYGRLTAGRGVNLKAPRVAYALEHRASPGTFDVCHECDNPECCNPDHLFLGKAADNVRDAVDKGRNAAPPIHVGDAHPQAKLTEGRVRHIRTSGLPAATLAAHHGVTVKTIYEVRRHNTWRHVR